MTQAPAAERLVVDEQLVHASLAYHFQDVPGLLSICSDADRWVGRRFTTDEAGVAAATRYVAELDVRSPKGIYTQVTTLREHPAKGRGGKDLAHGLTFLWADGDYGNVGHKPGLDDMPHPADADHVREIVLASGLPEPSGWWLSGGGYNPIWVLAEPYIIGGDDDRATIEQFTMGLQAVLGGTAYSHGCSWDTQIGNLDRLMRIPGTVNRKAGERSTGSFPGTGEPVDLAVMREAVQQLEPHARELLEKAAAEKRARHDARTGRTTATPPPRRAAFPRSGGGTSVFDIIASELTFRDVLEPAGWTYRGTAADGREKWLRPAGAEGQADSDYSLVCDDHVAVNWSERSGLPVGQQPSGRKLTVPTLWAHIHYGGDEREATRDVIRAAFDQVALTAARALPGAVLTRVRQHCRPPAQRRDVPPPPPDDDLWAAFEETAGPDPVGEDDEADGPDAIPGLIPEEFWAARPELQHIRQAGHSRTRSGDVALLSVLTRLSSLVSHRIRADTGIAGYASLNLFGGIIGPSGIGKSTGVEVADRLMPAPPELDFRDGLPLGSGEGLAEVFMGIVEEETGEVRKTRGGRETPVTVNVRKQVRHNAFFYVDEGATITRLMKERSGSTLGETLRSAAVGQTLGQTNASKDTSRYIPSGSYSLGLLVGFQPETVAPLFEEVAEGTPQRFVWVQVIDPSIPDVPPSWPGKLTAWREAATAPPGDEASRFVLVSFDESIKAELRAADLAKVRGHLDPAEFNQLDSQAPVMRVKLASLLAILAGRRHVMPEDWRLAQMLWEASCATRDAVLEYSAAQRRAEQERRTVARIEEEVRVDHAKQLAEEKRTERAVERLALRLSAYVHAKGPKSRSELRSRAAGREKRLLPDAYSYALLREWLVEAEGRFVPGPVPPS